MILEALDFAPYRRMIRQHHSLFKGPWLRAKTCNENSLGQRRLRGSPCIKNLGSRQVRHFAGFRAFHTLTCLSMRARMTDRVEPRACCHIKTSQHVGLDPNRSRLPV